MHSEDHRFEVAVVQLAGGGLSAGLRDLARIGPIMRGNGTIHERVLFPAVAVETIRAGGDRSNFPPSYTALADGSYKSMSWIFYNADGAYAARGIHGQTIYVNPTADVVIARFTSHPVAPNAANDPTSIPSCRAVGDQLAKCS